MQAYREWVCGGPLVDIQRPVMGGDTQAEHAQRMLDELAERAERSDRESRLLAQDFPRGCWVRAAERDAMWPDLQALLDVLPGPNFKATHSTASVVNAPTIPMLP